MKLKKILSLLLLALVSGFSQTALAEECCWIDVKTGKPVGSVPLCGGNLVGGTGAAIVDESDFKHARNPKTGQHFARHPDGCWVDVKTGKAVASAPLCGGNLVGGTGVAIVDESDFKHASNPKTGEHFVRVPCPPPAAVAPAPPEKPKEQPSGIGKLLQGVSVGVGVSGGKTVGRDDHKGDHRVGDRQHTSSTTKKLPAGCKCHPCTCSPCRCGG